MNRIVLTGNLTADPELRTTQSGVSVCSFTLAVQRRFKSANGEREADFIPIIVWRQQADICNTYLTKGKKCAVVGSIQTRSYQAQDGSTRHVTEVVAEEVEFLSPREQAQPRQPEPQTFNAQAQGQQTSFGYVPPAGQDDDDWEMPF